MAPEREISADQSYLIRTWLENRSGRTVRISYDCWEGGSTAIDVRLVMDEPIVFVRENRYSFITRKLTVRERLLVGDKLDQELIEAGIIQSEVEVVNS